MLVLGRENLSSPIGSMYGKFNYIWLICSMDFSGKDYK